MLKVNYKSFLKNNSNAGPEINFEIWIFKFCFIYLFSHTRASSSIGQSTGTTSDAEVGGSNPPSPDEINYRNFFNNKLKAYNSNQSQFCTSSFCSKIKNSFAEYESNQKPLTSHKIIMNSLTTYHPQKT